MATRSTIWYYDDNTQTYKGVYCHWDGYIGYNGKILFENYTTLNKVKELISLGQISSLDKTISTTQDYHRWRGEPIKIYEVSKFEDIFKYHEEYLYLFKDNEWYVCSYGERECTKLKDVLQQLKDN